MAKSPKVMTATVAVAATLLLAAAVYTTSSRTTSLLGNNNIYAETGMAVPPPAKPVVHHPHHPGMKAKATTAAEYEQRLGKDPKGNPLPQVKKPATHKSIWERMEDAYFHPAAGIKLTDKVRTAVFAKEGGSGASYKEKKGFKHWENWENGYFQPLGKGQKPSQKDRLAKYGLEGGGLKPNKFSIRALKAKKWQKWEDQMFGHDMSQVAARRLPAEPPKQAKKTRHFRLGGDTEISKPKVVKSGNLIDSIASKSWVTAAEVDGSKAPRKPIRFVDTIA